MIAYLGPFTMVYRTQIITDWVAKCHELKIPAAEVFDLSKILGNAVQIRQWGI